jgi:transposase-like protein
LRIPQCKEKKLESKKNLAVLGKNFRARRCGKRFLNEVQQDFYETEQPLRPIQPQLVHSLFTGSGMRPKLRRRSLELRH